MMTLQPSPLLPVTALPGDSLPPRPGSRRKRLWELDGHAHCPVLGACLPIAVLRRLVDKVLGGQAVADDYDLHCGAVADSKQRGPLAEALQRELDQRYRLALQQAAQAKTTEALAAWWTQGLRSQDIAGPLWATLTHPRCTPALAHQVEAEVHMLQHQVGIRSHADTARLNALLDENAVLTRALAAAQQRSLRQAAEHQQRCELLQDQLMQLRAQLLGRDTGIAALQDELRARAAATPDLASRLALAREGERLLARNHALQRSLLQAQQLAERLRQRLGAQAEARAHRWAGTLPSATPGATPAASHHAAPPPAEPAEPSRLDDQAVLCVGGRQASVPIYRRLVEATGGRFLHHDGGEEDNTAQLEAMVAAADLVICQTGCVSHNAYWRVKDQCKRSGKRCVFVESPSGAGLKRALQTLLPERPTPADALHPPTPGTPRPATD